MDGCRAPTLDEVEFKEDAADERLREILGWRDYNVLMTHRWGSAWTIWKLSEDFSLVVRELARRHLPDHHGHLGGILRSPRPLAALHTNSSGG